MSEMKDNLVLPKSESWKMFDQISPRYDLLNRILSFGLDVRWRKKLSKFLPKRKNLEILDLATGTGDVLITLLKRNANVHYGIGIDMAQKMLDVGNRKLKRMNLENKITLRRGDANKIPFEANTFDAVTMSFGIRNVENEKVPIQEMNRVLKSQGRALILEFSLPAFKPLRFIHLAYLRHVVPVMGFLVSGHYKAYKYLNQTIETFPYGDDFCQLMRDAGFDNVKANPLLFGIATIYQGDA